MNFTQTNNNAGDVVNSLTPCPAEFQWRDRVQKVGGDYTFEGIVVATFIKLSGVNRVVVENKEGVLHIFSPAQLNLIERPK